MINFFSSKQDTFPKDVLSELGFASEALEYNNLSEKTTKKSKINIPDCQFQDDIFVLGVIRPIDMKYEDVLFELDSYRSDDDMTTGSDAQSNSHIH